MLRISTYLDWHKTGIIMGTDDFFNSIGTKFWPAVNSAPYLFKMQAESQVWTWSSAILVCQTISQRTWVNILNDLQVGSVCVHGVLGSNALRSATLSKGSSTLPNHAKTYPSLTRAFLLWLWLKTTLKWTHRTDHFPCAWVALTRQPPMMCGAQGNFKILQGSSWMSKSARTRCSM